MDPNLLHGYCTVARELSSPLPECGIPHYYQCECIQVRFLMYPTTPLHDSEHLSLYLNALYLHITSCHSDKIFLKNSNLSYVVAGADQS